MPTGIVVSMQDEKSQIQNRAKAMPDQIARRADLRDNLARGEQRAPIERNPDDDSQPTAALLRQSAAPAEHPEQVLPHPILFIDNVRESERVRALMRERVRESKRE